jgi:hypothetical protein
MTQAASTPAPAPARPAAPNPWPYGIGAAFIICAAFLVALVVLANAHRHELVSPAYYEEEIAYQAQMERASRARALAAPASIRADLPNRQLLIALPPDHAGRHPSGLIHLYRPANSSQDQKIALAPDARGEQRLDLARLAPGLWRIRLEWTVGGVGFFADQKMVLPR